MSSIMMHDIASSWHIVYNECHIASFDGVRMMTILIFPTMTLRVIMVILPMMGLLLVMTPLHIPHMYFHIISDWSLTDLRLISNWSETDLKLTWDWFQIDLRPISNWSETDLKLIWDWSQTDLNVKGMILITCLGSIWILQGFRDGWRILCEKKMGFRV